MGFNDVKEILLHTRMLVCTHQPVKRNMDGEQWGKGERKVEEGHDELNLAMVAHRVAAGFSVTLSMELK